MTNAELQNQLNIKTDAYRVVLETMANQENAITSLAGQLAKLPKVNAKPLFGINVHMFDSNYSDVDGIIAKLQYLGCTNVRQDFDIYGSGTNIGKMLNHSSWVNDVLPKFNAAGIKVRPMFYIRGDDGYATFRAIANNYPYFTEMEIGNENAILSLLTGTGWYASNYDTAKLDTNTRYVTAAFLALLTIGRPINIITSITWIHYYYINYLRGLGANLSLSVHSYTDGFYNVANQSQTLGLNAWQAAKSKFGNQVFEIGETNFMPLPDASNYTDALQLQKGAQIFDDTWGSGIPTWWYELVDRPTRPGREGHFGLFRSDGSPKPLCDYIKGQLDGTGA
ncbi:hypothetical protein A0256_23295 [Mucilaginibacter sp. PAMC 26640]|nr:hypothetical protein A0256_23295 [Mucilaginibacter sp. PAMC 26640]